MEQAKFQIKLDPEYEEQIIMRFSQLADTAIDTAIERASIQRRYVTQQELMKHLGIGYDTLQTLVEHGLRYIHLGRSKMYDLEEVSEVLETLKK